MSGRIYDSETGTPVCGRCGSNMYTSSQRNFYGIQCKRRGCVGECAYHKPIKRKTSKPVVSKQNLNGKYILQGVFSEFDYKAKYTYIERFRNFLYTLIYGY